MPRYIDADALQKSLQYVCTVGGKWGEAERMYIEAFSDFVDGYPTADVVEVVRCKDCKYAHEILDPEIEFKDEYLYCYMHCGGKLVPKTGFCHIGKTKEENDAEIH